MRPLYQTDVDAKNETYVVNQFHAQFSSVEAEEDRVERGHVVFKQTKTTAHYDFEMKKAISVRLNTGGLIRIPVQDPIALVEVKKRNPSYEDYPTYKLSKIKCDALIKLSEEKNIPVFLLVGWRDKIGWMYVNKPLSSLSYKNYFLTDRSGPSLNQLIDTGEANIETWGRHDRNDPKDVELCYEWSNDNFSTFHYSELD
tara:strand:- start:30 stop:626 length:597 start_codon:yes stop_codon:yes gene_type:complete